MKIIELGAPILDSVDKAALIEVIDSGWITMGPKVQEFERDFAALHRAPHAIATSSATAALQLILQALDIGSGDEVLVPTMSFVATANVVLHVGARPVFVDIVGLSEPHLSLEDARSKVGPQAKAVVIMHYGGFAIDMAPWLKFCDQFGLHLVEDAAHTAGLNEVGTPFGAAAAFSFFSNKNMTTAEGGMVLTRSAALADRISKLRSHGMTASTLDRTRGRAVGYDVIDFGHNFRMDELRAALGVTQLRRLPAWNGRRRELASRYRAALSEDLPRVVVPFASDWPSSFHIMPVVLPAAADRSRIAANLRQAGVQSSIHYPPIHEFTKYRETYDPISLPLSEGFGNRELTLPLHPGLSDEDVDYVVQTLAAAVED